MTLGWRCARHRILVDEFDVAIEKNIHTAPGRGEARGRVQFLMLPERRWSEDFWALLSILAVFVPSFFPRPASPASLLTLSLAVGLRLLALICWRNTWCGALHLASTRTKCGPDHGDGIFHSTALVTDGCVSRAMNFRLADHGLYVVSSVSVSSL